MPRQPIGRTGAPATMVAPPLLAPANTAYVCPNCMAAVFSKARMYPTILRLEEICVCGTALFLACKNSSGKRDVAIIGKVSRTRAG